MKKRVEQIIREIRLQAFAVNSSYSNEVLCLYLNEAQNQIREVIFLANNESNILKNVHYLDTVNGVQEYDLPERMFAENSIDLVRAQYSFASPDNIFSTIYPVSLRNFNNIFGYSLLNKQIWISSVSPYTDLVRLQIIYSGVLPTLAERSGIIQSGTPTEIQLSAGFDEELALKSDFITVIDASGVQVETDIRINNFDTGTGLISVDSTAGLATGQYVLSGEFAINIPKIPDVTYDYLKKYVERRIAKEDGSKDFPTADLFSEEEKANIANIFAESSKDVSLPEFSPYSITI